MKIIINVMKDKTDETLDQDLFNDFIEQAISQIDNANTSNYNVVYVQQSN